MRPSELLCTSCEEWKPDEAFSPAPARLARRHRHAECKDCTAKRKRAERAAWPESKRTEEARKRRSRAAA